MSSGRMESAVCHHPGSRWALQDHLFQAGSELSRASCNAAGLLARRHGARNPGLARALAARCMAGQTLAPAGITSEVTPLQFPAEGGRVSVRLEFPSGTPILGPEMWCPPSARGRGWRGARQDPWVRPVSAASSGAGNAPICWAARAKVFPTVKNSDKTMPCRWIARQAG